jgi:hypothetical protein
VTFSSDCGELRVVSPESRLKHGTETTKSWHVPLAAAAMLLVASAAMAQDARARAIELESDAANGIQPYVAYSARPRIIWRKPEIRPLTWEEQRVFDRSSQLF